MDERIQKAIELSNFRLNLFNLKEHIKLKVDGMLGYAINGGLFKASPELIAFVASLINDGYQHAVLIDMNGNPIEITDLLEFKENLTDRYFQATNYYHVEYQKLKTDRTVVDQFRDLFDDKS